MFKPNWFNFNKNLEKSHITHSSFSLELNCWLSFHVWGKLVCSQVCKKIRNRVNSLEMWEEKQANNLFHKRRTLDFPAL